ncbi:MAG: hypothetical protein FWE35_02340 [Streptosporangiales bacterium]|nr:hypothetical protein [Streptosporangiales bacterium]
MQSRLYSPGYASPARWVLFEPATRRAFAALGKDVVPDVISILSMASSGIKRNEVLEAHPHVTSGRLGSLIRARVLLESPPSSSDRAMAFTESFHQANVDYPFFDYGSPEVTESESKLLDHYASLWPPPPAVLERHGTRYPLPPGRDDSSLVLRDDAGMTLDALAWVLKLLLAPTGEIRTRHVTCVRRTTPSGGARHPTEVAVVLPLPLGNVPSGTYTYDVASHSLVAEPSAAHDAYLARLGEHGVGLVIRSRVDRAMWRYRDLRALRPVLIDSGHVTELATYLLGRLSMDTQVLSAPITPVRASWLREPEVIMVRARRLPPGSRRETARAAPVRVDDGPGRFMANPAMVLRFAPALSAHVLWPVSARITLSPEDFLILNHCLPSARGDRDQSVSGIAAAVAGTTRASVERLADCGALLPADKAASLYDDLRLWIRHEWYLAFLAYSEALERGSADPAVSRVPADAGYLTDAGALSRRRTSRSFGPEPVAFSSVKELLGQAVPAGSLKDLEVSVAVWNVDGLPPGLYRWRDSNLSRAGDVPERQSVADCSAGQSATSSGALTLWLSARTTPERPARYLMDLVDLGRLGQRVCMAATERRIAVFLSPAVYDQPTCSMLGIEQPERRLTYVFGLGSPASPQSTPMSSSVTE